MGKTIINMEFFSKRNIDITIYTSGVLLVILSVFFSNYFSIQTNKVINYLIIINLVVFIIRKIYLKNK